MRTVTLSIAMATLTLAQTSGSQAAAKFDLASIKATAVGDGSLRIDFSPGGRFSAKNATLQILLRNAYGLEDYQIVDGPGWTTTVGFDIEARADAGSGDPDRREVLKMIQALLADRFHLATHRETRQLPVYNLVTGKNGPRIKTADPSATPDRSLKMGQLSAQKMSMNALANLLAFDLKRPVKNETALEGEFAFTLEWTRGLGEFDFGPSARPSLFTAVQEQLGLQLKAARGPVEVLVIDQVERPSQN
jgi:uncharacterized protein (TIGR03435 family)